MTSESPLLNFPVSSLGTAESERRPELDRLPIDTDLVQVQRERDLAQQALLTLLILNARQAAEIERNKKVIEQYRADIMAVKWDKLSPPAKILAMLVTGGFFRNRVASLYEITHQDEGLKES